MNDELWQAIVECDHKYDGQYYYGLRTTGIFCKPSCKSRTPKREHVKIFTTPHDARNAGLRPCKRCRPEELHWRSSDEELARKAADLITSRYTEPLTLNEIASSLFVSPYYLQRSFKRVMTISPGKFLTMKRMEAAKRLLVETRESVTNIALQIGFRSGAHFSFVFHKETGWKPTEFRNLYEKQQ